MKGKGNVVLMIGQRNSGKTTKTKLLLQQYKKKEYIFDFRAEYGHEFKDFDNFISYACTLSNHNVVIEEATIHIPRRSDNKDVKNLLTGSSHFSNNIFLIYHSLRSIPDYVFEQVNYYYLFHTADNESVVRRIYRDEPEIIEDFIFVKRNSGDHFYKVRKRM